MFCSKLSHENVQKYALLSMVVLLVSTACLNTSATLGVPVVGIPVLGVLSTERGPSRAFHNHDAAQT